MARFHSSDWHVRRHYGPLVSTVMADDARWLALAVCCPDGRSLSPEIMVTLIIDELDSCISCSWLSLSDVRTQWRMCIIILTQLIITSAKEVMFSPPVHLCVCFFRRITQKPLDRFSWNLVEGWDMDQDIIHVILYFFYHLWDWAFFYIFIVFPGNKSSWWNNSGIFRGLISMSVWNFLHFV